MAVEAGLELGAPSGIKGNDLYQLRNRLVETSTGPCITISTESIYLHISFFLSIILFLQLASAVELIHSIGDCFAK